MEICPLCNGLIQINCTCICGGDLTDAGPVSDYTGPYSPYDNMDPGLCTHLFACAKCGRDTRATIPSRFF